MTFIFLIIGVVAILVIIGIAAFFIELPAASKESPYQKRRYLMDSNAEFGLFKILVELYGNKYYIFPQVNYSHLLEPKKMEWREGRRFMSKLDRKSADFVLCDKEHVVPQLVIELDGPTHARERTKVRDGFINDTLKAAGLPVLHIPVGPYTSESIKEVVDKALIAE